MLKTILTSLDGIEDAVKPLYAEADGKFILQVEGIDAHPDVSNLKNAYERVKADKQTAMQERDAFKARFEGLPEDFDVKEWDRLKKGGKADPDELIKLRKQLESERDEYKGKYEGLLTEGKQKAIRESVQAALAAQGVPEGARRGAALDMMDGKKVEMQGDTPVIDTDMGPMSIADYAARWVGSNGQAYVAQPSGGGARGGQGNGTAGKPGNMGGSREDRTAAIRDKFPDLSQ